jgi:membrane-bound lytic murein transglycosylase B
VRSIVKRAAAHPAAVFLVTLALMVSGLVVAGARAAARDGTAQDPSAEQPDRPPFQEWLQGVRQEALARGISGPTVARALDGVEPLPVVLDRDSNQVESKLSIETYLSRRLNRVMVRSANRQHASHATLLARVSDRYGVPSSIIVAIWGLESNFGKFSGVRPVVAALATLAYDPRRSTLFREELFGALTILDRGDIEPERLKGSWAGAMGQPQFLPSSYLKYAQDFDGDGRRDIWSDEADIFASIASYLAGHGWTKGERWGRQVQLGSKPDQSLAGAAPLRANGCRAMREMSEPRPLSEWRTLGIRLSDGRPLPSSTIEASLLRTDARAFLVYKNYEALLGYNCAHAYALAVATLADRIQ